MPRCIEITSSANARIKQVVRLREHRQRRKAGLFIAEGQREIERALAAGLACHELYCCAELLDHRPDQRGATAGFVAGLPAAALCVDVPAGVFRKIAYVREPEGVLGVFEQPRYTWDDLPAVNEQTLWLVVVGSEKPGNLGAMVRTADAAGCQAVIAAGSAVDALNPNAIRTSTGAVFTMPVVAAPQAEVRERLLATGLRIMASTLERAVPHTQARLTGPAAIVIGPEDVGLDGAWLDAADRSAGERLHIAMHSRSVDSLNAAAAAAVLLFEALRQRGANAP